jgi:Tol biopolymer transport system component
MKTLKVLFVLMSISYLCNGIAHADFIFGEPNMVPNVNSDSSDGSPQISRDGLELYMSSTWDGGVDKIWVSKRDTIQDPWSVPTKLDAPVNSASSQNFPSLSADGLELYFSEGQNGTSNPNGYGGADIWVLTRASKDDPWNVPMNLGPVINSESDEYTPCISADGLELYFSSNVPGGSGYADIFIATRQTKDDSWGEPVNLGPNVNTDQAEFTPFISTDGLLLFFSRGFSKSHIYVCRRTSTEEPWGPANFFAPINSGNSDDVWGASPGSAEYHACFADGDSTIYFTRGSNVFATDYNVWQVKVTPIVDLNSDGIVDSVDMCILVDNWHTENTLCDIAPAPLGDGFVDVQDLIVLAEHLFEEIPPAVLGTPNGEPVE